MRIFYLISFLLLANIVQAITPIKELLDRIDPGASSKFIIEQQKGANDFFELDQQGDKVVIRGNNPVSIATGINWYLKYHAGIHLSWNGMQAKLPTPLPVVKKKERHETTLPYRYDFNYCTYSYSMAFWDWNRWEKEIDWMALHGINLPLSIVGTEGVWYNVLEKLGYSHEEISQFIAGPGFTAWWLMNNLEGWGGANPKSWYTRQIGLQRQILKRMREYGIEPVLPGYSGMLPNNAKEKLGVNVQDPGMWCGFRRPAFLQPTDPRFQQIASLYYKELTKLYGKANYYSMDPFHEGGNTAGVDLKAAGSALMKAMKKVNSKATWVIQAWGANPRNQMIDHLEEHDLLVLDLFSEARPQWGEPNSTWYRKDGFGKHDWIYCMLLNFGGNVGLHGKMGYVIEEFYKARKSTKNTTLRGVGMTMEGIENNPVMFELLTELPWRPVEFKKEDWLQEYTKARYGTNDAVIQEAWRLLANSIYSCPDLSVQQGTTESVFCARPGLDIYQASVWAESELYYEPDDVIRAARLMVSVADNYRGNNNFEYDLVDIVRQAIAEKGRRTQLEVTKAYRVSDRNAFKRNASKFIRLIHLQDELLGVRPEFMVGSWIAQARQAGNTEQEKNHYEWNARVQISTWGNREGATAGLHDYSHREWNGILKDFYAPRWEKYFDYLQQKMDKKNPTEIDFYAIEEPWSRDLKSYPTTPQGNVTEVVKRVFMQAGL